MDWSEAVEQQLASLVVDLNQSEHADRIVRLLDYTSLGGQSDAQMMSAFFSEVLSLPVSVAAVCVWPEFVAQAADVFANKPVKVATVANFPHGEAPLESVLIEINKAIGSGAQEVDVVMPYHRYLAGEKKYTQTFVEACKDLCGQDVLLKVILETGVLGDLAIIADASYDVLVAGADFIKTSTGKASVGATMEAAATMLLVIRHLQSQSRRPLGFKAAGGIRTFEQAAAFVALSDQIMSRKWTISDNFRLGTSQLLAKAC